MTIIFTFVYLGILFKLITTGHSNAVRASEQLIYEKYNQLGSAGDASRKLMREAGYRV